jgi:hypothetical protein
MTTIDTNETLLSQREIYNLYKNIFDNMNYVDENEWEDFKNEHIDNLCKVMDISDIKKIVNKYYVIEVIGDMKNEYGTDFNTDLIQKTMETRYYNSLFYNIVNEFIENEKISMIDSDYASDADTEEYFYSDYASDADTEEEYLNIY